MPTVAASACSTSAYGITQQGTSAAHHEPVTNGSSVHPGPLGSRSPLLPILLVGLALGIAIGLGLGRAPTAPPAPTAAASASGAPPSATPSRAVVAGASVADLMQAYYATRETSAGLEPVVCTTETRLACQGVPARMILNVEGANPTLPPIPGPDELWPQLGPVRLTHVGGGVDTILMDDLSPALGSQVVVQMAGPGQSWSGTTLTPVLANGAVAIVDLGSMAPGRYVLLIRQVLAVPPDPQGLVESWKAIGIEVDP